MKKTYLQPELEVVDIKFSQPLMAGSPVLDVNNVNVDEPGELLAPGMPNDLPGVPSVNEMLGIPTGPSLPF